MAHRYIFLENIAGADPGRGPRRQRRLSAVRNAIDPLPFGIPDETAPPGTRALDRIVKKLAHRMRTSVEDYSLTDTAGWHAARARGKAVAESPFSGRRLEVTEHRIWVNGLGESFRGFRVVHLTDIHHGLYLPLQDVIEAVELVNDLAPDLVALTGDFVTFSRAYIEPVAAILGCLRARHGVFAVLGNHDFRVGADEMTRALRREKIHVLRNRHVRLLVGGESLFVAGVDDLGYRADLARALRGIPPGASSVLLSHNPAIIRRAARSGVSLVLSGHTHGGQVRLPLVGTIYGRSPERLRFKIGWDRLGETQIYVSRGIGTVVLPVRFRCPAEIPHFHLEPSITSTLSS